MLEKKVTEKKVTKEQVIDYWQKVSEGESSDFLNSYSDVTIEDSPLGKDIDIMLFLLLGRTTELKLSEAANPALEIRSAVLLLNDLNGYFPTNWSKILPNLFLGPVEGEPSLKPAAMIVNIHPPENREVTELKDGEVRYPNALNSEGRPRIGAEEIADMTVTGPVIKAIAACLLNNKPVWVHCSSGKDRSPIIVTLALMVLYNTSAENAYRFVQIKRPVVGTTSKHQKKYWDFIEDFESNSLSALRSEIVGWRDSPPVHEQLIQEAQAAAAAAQARIIKTEPSAPPSLTL